jgi:hypothetical protein
MERILEFVTITAVIITNMLFFTATVNAADKKAYPAFMCRPEGVNHDIHFDFSPWRVTRTSGGAAWLLCPIVKDNFGSAGAPGFGPSGISVEVSIDDHSFSRNVTCELWGLNKDMKREFYVVGKTNATGIQSIKLGAQKRADFEFLRCQLPDNAPKGQYFRLIGYTVTE